MTRSPDRPIHLWVAAALVAANLLVYSQVATHEFTNFDDPQYVTDNPIVSGGLTWAGITLAFTTAHAANWHPLTWISHMVDVQLFGSASGAHHLTNLALHIVATLLLFGWLTSTTGRVVPSGVVAALFAVHPAHVESVAWVSERKDVLSAVFWMLTLWAYVAWVRRPGWRRYAVLLGVFTLGLMTKPMLVTLPFVLLLVDWWPLGRIELDKNELVAHFEEPLPKRATSSFLLSSFSPASLRHALWEKLPLFALAAASSVITVIVQQQGGAVRGLDALPLARRIANALVSYVGYISKMVWPTDLAPVYPYPAALSFATVALAAVVLVVVSFDAVRHARRTPYVAVGWLWYVGTLVPVIGLVQVGSQPLADRYTYVPFVGLFIILAWAAAGVVQRWPRSRIIVAAVTLAAISGCAVIARQQVSFWRNSVVLWERTLAVTDQNYRAHTYLAHALAARGQHAEAVAQYRSALKMRRDYVDALNNLGPLLEADGQSDEPIALYRRAVTLAPTYAAAHSNLGAALARRGLLDEAATHLEEALRLDPDLLDARRNLGNVRLGQGESASAASHLAEVVRRRPADVETQANLGNALVALGRFDEAVGRYQEALRLAPDVATAHNGLGVALASLNRLDEAMTHYREAIRLQPEFVDPYSNLGRTLARLGQDEAALRVFLDGLARHPDDAALHFDAAVLHARAGRIAEALKHVDLAVMLDPRHDSARGLRDQLRRGR